jgi:ABC-type polysaccharide transport system, permease component
LKLVFGFVASIALAVMLNEVRNKFIKRSIKTISYLPHFISWVVAANLVFVALSPDGGIINVLLVKAGFIKESIFFLGEGKYFWMVSSLSNVWKEVGGDAIIFLSAITNIDLQIFESADIDGAGRLRKISAITLPSSDMVAPWLKRYERKWIFEKSNSSCYTNVLYWKPFRQYFKSRKNSM